MELYDSIRQRKSCRKFTDEKLPAETLKVLEEAIAGFDRLYPDAPLTYRFFNEASGKFKVDAPHYLMIEGGGSDRTQESAGFLFEQLVLWLDLNEIGSVWLGSTVDAETGSKDGDILALGFGRSSESIHREASDFKRKPINEITNDPDDACIQAVHVAPSGMNTQPWYFEKADGEVRVYLQKLKVPVSLIYKHTQVDMGIALCHYALAAKHEGRPFAFERSESLPPKKGFLPFGIIR